MFKRFLDHWLGQQTREGPEVRHRWGMAAGLLGIGCNGILCCGKLIAGWATGSVSIVADGINNLSDAAASVVTMAGFYLAGQRADAKHPFGHGRSEYIAGLFIAMAILWMGLELGSSSLSQLVRPKPLAFSWIAVIFLTGSMAVKLGLYGVQRELGRRLSSQTLQAAGADSLSDILSTGVVLVATLADHWFSLHVDGAAGLLVACFILKTGWDAMQHTLDPLLGCPMDAKLAQEVQSLVASHPRVLGVHDVIYHDYGPGRAMMSLHAEVSAESTFLEVHELIDQLERELKERYQIETVIHMDPVVNDEPTTQLRQQVVQLVQALHPDLELHDFRLTGCGSHTRVTFDVVVPHGFSFTDEQVQGILATQIQALSSQYQPVIAVDHPYIQRAEGEGGVNILQNIHRKEKK